MPSPLLLLSPHLSPHPSPVPTISGSIQVAQGRGSAILSKIVATEKHIQRGGSVPHDAWHADDELHDPRHVHSNISARRKEKHHGKAYNDHVKSGFLASEEEYAQAKAEFQKRREHLRRHVTGEQAGRGGGRGGGARGGGGVSSPQRRKKAPATAAAAVWFERHDADTKCYYYVNEDTGESRWHKPVGPYIPLPGREHTYAPGR